MLAVIVLVSKFFGEIAERLQYPSVLGYIIAGLLFSPVPALVLGKPLIPPSNELAVFGELGAILILFSAGIREININFLLKNKVASFASSVFGYIFSFAIVLFVGMGLKNINSIFVLTPVQLLIAATAFSITSITTSVRALIDIKKLNTDMGRTILASSVIDDILGLVLFVLIYSTLAEYHLSISSILKIGLFAAITFLVFVIGSKTLPNVVGKLKSLEVEEAQFSIAFILMLAFAYMTQLFGFHGVIGAFLAGMVISRTTLKDSGFSEKLASLTYGIFAPLFFAWVGMMVNPVCLTFVIFLIIAGVLAANFIGSFIGAIIGKMDSLNAVGVGIGVLPRGGFDLMILAIAKSSGILNGVASDILFNAGVMLALVSIIITPILFRIVVEGKELE